MGWIPKIIVKKILKRPPVVPVVRLSGAIAQSSTPMRGAINLAGMDDILVEAFETKRAKAVALAINCPGGAPVQAAMLHDRIRALAKQHELPVIAFCEDVAASGGYWIACAADEIFADANSLVGSIGVISSGFGLSEAIAKLGIERRMHTAGTKKSFMDPFRPESEQDLERLNRLLGEMHEDFKRHVRERREGRLKSEEEELFSGDFWSGGQALEHGLIDGIGHLHQVLQERFGDEVKLPVIEEQKGFLQRTLGLGTFADPSLWAERVVGAVLERLRRADLG